MASQELASSESAIVRLVTRSPGVERPKASPGMHFRKSPGMAAAAAEGGFAASIGCRLLPLAWA